MKGVIDTTLREGEQSAHVYFDLEEKVRIIYFLAKIGIEEIEAGALRLRLLKKSFCKFVIIDFYVNQASYELIVLPAIHNKVHLRPRIKILQKGKDPGKSLNHGKDN